MNMEKTFYKSYKELVSDYFNLEEFKVGENAPKLSKQLSNKGIEYSQGELQAFSELLLTVFHDEEELVFTFLLSDKLPAYSEAENWAFDGSCNCPGGAGEVTSAILQTSEIARYCYIYDELNRPTARFYYLETEDGELGVSDLYSDEGHGYYLSPKMLLSIFYDRRLSDFEETTDRLINHPNDGGFWANMASNQYKKFVTCPGILAQVNSDEAEETLSSEGVYWSPNLDSWVNPENNGSITFCENIDDYEHEDYTCGCEHCGCIFSTNGDYVETDDGLYYCSEDCCSAENIYSEYYERYILEPEAFYCEDCENTFYSDDMEEGSDGCMYCFNCIHEHLEDEEDELEDIA